MKVGEGFPAVMEREERFSERVVWVVERGARRLGESEWWQRDDHREIMLMKTRLVSHSGCGTARAIKSYSGPLNNTFLDIFLTLCTRFRYPLQRNHPCSPCLKEKRSPEKHK